MAVYDAALVVDNKGRSEMDEIERMARILYDMRFPGDVTGFDKVWPGHREIYYLRYARELDLAGYTIVAKKSAAEIKR